ncbi:MAG TPA: glycosyltransferase [Acidimicrobiales bacterium]|nr:glycosyltransferase [Acidimicrobiales bacterium]
MTDPHSGVPSGIAAAILTHMRPRLAVAAVRSLIDEGIAPDRITVVVNPPGGLEDPALEHAVHMVRLEENLGPAGGFARAITEAFADPTVSWAYVCEDDLTLLHLPQGRLRGLLERVAEAEAVMGPIGAVVPFGRRFVPRSGHAAVTVPRRGLPGELAPVDVSTWGATLLSRAVVDAGVLPDPELFFGFEDFDFFSRVRQAGFAVAVDVPSARKVAHHQTSAARDVALAAERPVDDEEPWRAYYFARNFFELARRHGRRSWMAWHLLYSLRRLQLAGSSKERQAIVRGLLDGARGRLGVNPRYVRQVGERATPVVPEPAVEADGDRVSANGHATAVAGQPRPAELAAGTVAMVLCHNAPQQLLRWVAAVDAQTTPPGRILVVDNASTPPLVVPDRPAGAAAVQMVRSDVNGGPAGGWAIALGEFAAGDAELAWVLDDDMVPDPDCLEVLLTAAAEDPKRAFCFPRSVEVDGSVGAWGSWCGLVVSRHIVETVGLPRPELFWWAEDSEYLLWRIPQAGFERRIVDGALVQHDAIRQAGPVPTWKYYYEARNMLYYHLHVMHKVGWYPKNVTKLVARALVREHGMARLRSLAAMARGWFDGAFGRLGVRVPVPPMQERSAPAASAGAPT